VHDRYDARVIARAELRDATTRLVAEFAGALPAGTVVGTMVRAREELLRNGVRDGLVTATEALARDRLRDRVPVHAA
jgi:hypothetical protein